MLDTTRLRLRPWSIADKEAFRPIATDPLVMRYISTGNPWTDEQIDEFVTRQMRWYTRHGYCLWRLLRSSDDALIGICGIQPLTVDGQDEVEIGWWLTPSEWGKGLATEAATAALRFAFDTAGLRRIIAIAQPENRASRRVMDKLGMRFERDAVHKGIPIVLYSTTASSPSPSR